MRVLQPIIAVLLLVSTVTVGAEPATVPQYSVWVGSYTCAQGITSIKLTIETSASGGAAMGLFEFGPHDRNPDLPRGSFWMKGRVTRDGRGALVVQLAPDRWKVRPTGWVMVPIEASGDREDRTLAGQIPYTSCGAIDVRRARS